MSVKPNLNLSRISDEKLIRMHAEISKEAGRRGLALTVGELGEKLAIELFGKRPDLPVLAAAPRGTKNIDAISRRGERYSIKTVQRAKKTGTIYPDREEPDKQLFEYLLIVKLTDDLELSRVVAISWLQFCSCRKWDVTMKAWYVGITKQTLDAGLQIHPLMPRTDKE